MPAENRGGSVIGGAVKIGSSSSSSSILQQQQKNTTASTLTAAPGGGGAAAQHTSSSSSLLPEDLQNLVYLRIHVAELNIQKCMHFSNDTTAWEVKQKLLSSLPTKTLDEALNYGLFCPHSNGKAGKFLDDERTLAQYPLPGPIGYLELKYKRRVYKMNVDEKTLRSLHARHNVRKFLEYVQTANVEKITKLCERGFDPNLNVAAVIPGGADETPLTLATLLKQPMPMLKALVHGGAHLDFRTQGDGATALHRATQRNNFAALQALLDLGASPDYKDLKSLTPLYYAVTLAGDAHCCERLLNDYASINGVHDAHGWYEVHQACRMGLVKHLEHLVYYGGDEVLIARNTSGNTPLHIAAASNQESCVRYLLFRGADKFAQNYAKQNSQQVSILAGNYELADIIAKHSVEDTVKHADKPSYNPRRRGGRRLINGKPAPVPQQSNSANLMYMTHSDIASNISSSVVGGTKKTIQKQQQQKNNVVEEDEEEEDEDEPQQHHDAAAGEDGIKMPRSVSDINGWVASTAKRSSRHRHHQQKQQQHRSKSTAVLGGERHTATATTATMTRGSEGGSSTCHSPALRSASNDADSHHGGEDEEEDDDDDAVDELSSPSTSASHNRRHRHHQHHHNNVAATVERRISNNRIEKTNNPLYANGSLSSFEMYNDTQRRHHNQMTVVAEVNHNNNNSKKVKSAATNHQAIAEDTSGVVTDKSSCNSSSPQPLPTTTTTAQSSASLITVKNKPNLMKQQQQQPSVSSESSSSTSSSGIAIHHLPADDIDDARESFRTNSKRPSMTSTNTIRPMTSTTNTLQRHNSSDNTTLRSSIQRSRAAAVVVGVAGARTVQVARGAHGFGFVLRGSRSGTFPNISEETSMSSTENAAATAVASGGEVPPAMQYLDDVDVGGPGDSAGLCAGDFLLAINGEDVRAYPHHRCVNMIRQCADTVTLTILTPSMYNVVGNVGSGFSRLADGGCSVRSINSNSFHMNINGGGAAAATAHDKNDAAALVRSMSQGTTLSRPTKAAPAPPRRSPHTTLSTGDRTPPASTSTSVMTDLDDSLSTTDSAFLPPPSLTSDNASQHYQRSGVLTMMNEQQQTHNYYAPSAVNVGTNQQLQQLRHSSSSGGGNNNFNNKAYSSVSQMKRTQKQKRRAATAADGVAGTVNGGVLNVGTQFDDFYYQPDDNDVVVEQQNVRVARMNEQQQQRSGTANRSKSESRTLHTQQQQRKTRKNVSASADDDATLIYQTSLSAVGGEAAVDPYRQRNPYQHLTHSHTFHNGLHPNDVALFQQHGHYEQQQQQQPNNNYSSRTLGILHQQRSVVVGNNAHEHQGGAATLNMRRASTGTALFCPPPNPEQHTQQHTHAHQGHAHQLRHQHSHQQQQYPHRLDPISGSPAMVEPMPDYYDDEDDNGNDNEDVMPYSAGTTHHAHPHHPPQHSMSVLSFPTSSSSMTPPKNNNSKPPTQAAAAAAGVPKSILRSRLPQAPAPPPPPAPAFNTDSAAVAGSSDNGNNSAFANAISNAAATLSRKRATTTSDTKPPVSKEAGEDSISSGALLAGVANITKPLIAPVGTATAAAATTEMNMFQADLKRALERRRVKIQQATDEEQLST